jgi:hypothetical protein
LLVNARLLFILLMVNITVLGGQVIVTINPLASLYSLTDQEFTLSNRDKTRLVFYELVKNVFVLVCPVIIRFFLESMVEILKTTSAKFLRFSKFPVAFTKYFLTVEHYFTIYVIIITNL